MLELHIPAGQDWFDDTNQVFIPVPALTLRLEHSLGSVSKWESRFERAFLGKQEKTSEETLAYIEMMILDENFPPGVSSRFSKEHFDQINNYINAPMTATKIQDRPGSQPSRETITSELVYYWMVTFNIPFDCETWHLNRLLMLIRVCNLKNSSGKKMNRQELASRNRSVNAQRRAASGSKG
jgi:hypothetical protein